MARIDPEAVAIDVDVNIGSSVAGLGLGTNRVWVTTLSGELLELDPITAGIVQRRAVGLTELGPPLEAFGSIWIAALDENVVARIDLADLQ